MRKLKHHEQKLLKKVDLLHWKTKDNSNENQVLRRYHITDRDSYNHLNKLRGLITKLANKLSSELAPEDPGRQKMSKLLLNKLYQLGLIPIVRDLGQCEKLTVSAFYRRRLPAVMMRLKMAENLQEATTFIEQGHIRVGVNTIRDPSFFVSKHMEELITWVDASKIKRKILEYHNKADDYDLLANQ